MPAQSSQTPRSHATSSRALSPPAPTHTGRGIKSFFSRTKSVSPESADLPTSRSRLRSFIGDTTKVGSPSKTPISTQRRTTPGVAITTASSGGSKDATAKARQRTLSSEVTLGRQRLQKELAKEVKVRLASPVERTQRQLRYNPTALPAMQKGDDGKWQPPSLSRGSMSTSALALLHQEGDAGDTVTPTPKGVDERTKRGHKHTLTGLFQSTARHRSIPPETAIGMRRGESGRQNPPAESDMIASKRPAEASRNDPSPAGSDSTWQQVSPPQTPSRNQASVRQAPSTTVKPDPRRTSLDNRRPATAGPPPPTPISPLRAPGNAASAVPASSASPATPIRSSASLSGSMPPPPIPAYARHDSSPTSVLSRDHYLLRLSTSFIVKSLTPVIRGSSFVQNDRHAEVRQLADDRLSAMARMEKAWGGDWIKAANTLASAEQSVSPGEMSVIGSSEAKVRSVFVGDRAKERERKAWIEAMKDGVLLCFLLNHLFPAQPSHIPRINLSEDGILRATNLTRFITACQTVGLLDREIFGLADLQEASEISLGRVAHTVIALARLAGPTNAAVGRSRSPPNSKPGSRASSRPPSRNGSTPASPARSPPTTQRRTSVDLSRSKRISCEGTLPVVNPAYPAGQSMDRQGSNDSRNELHSKFEVITDRKLVVDLEDPASWRTPTTSTFALPAVPPELPSIKRTPMPRSVTQPNISPSIRPKSPTSSPSSRSITPVGKLGNLQIRPSLRPRNTTGSRVSVSFADNEPSSPRTENSDRGLMQSPGALYSHSRERTPSLISSGSRVTSGYSRSSAVLSVATVVGADHSNAIDLTEEMDDEGMMTQLRERRMSEKKLQEARQKILGTLLSSEDLPADLRQAVKDNDSKHHSAGQEDARNTALMDSLASLEGTRLLPLPSSPRHRPIARRGHSVEVDRVVEEEEQNQALISSQLSSDSSRPSGLRRLSSNGKVFVVKRSASPSSNLASPTGISFPSTSPGMSSSNMLRTTSLNSYQPTEKAERRQSDGYPRQKLGHGRDGTMSSDADDSARPLQMRISSMVNLPTTGMERSPSLFRESSNQSVTRLSQHLQVLEFHEPGCPVVKYQLGNCIGRGQFGSVYRSLNLSTGQMVAIKRIRLHGMREDEVTDVMREVELLKRLSHPSIVKYEGMSRDEEYLNIVLEFVENGSLGQTLKAFGNFNEKLVSSYVAKILEGLDYLHSQGVVHCDLKAANILSTKNGNVKLSDFGVSLNMKAKGATKRVSEVAGTPNWMAPEVISLAGASFASDIWSLGCTIIELLTGKPPYFDIGNSMTVLFRIVEDDMPPLPSNISDDLTDFLKLCFIKDPKARPAAVVMFEHPWLKALNPELALRPQDSVPFLRRVSMDLRRVDSNRLFENGRDAVEDGRKHRHSMASSHGREGSGSDKEHVLIKTTFGKAVTCRICLGDVRKVGVLCQDCGLIAHTSCASKASPRCDIHEQLAIFTRQQEILQSNGPSRVASPQPSFEGKDTHLTALPGKIFNGFKRSKSKGGLTNPMSPSQVDLTSHLESTRRPTSKPQVQAYARPSLETDPSMKMRKDIAVYISSWAINLPPSLVL
ncbi:STE/STE11/CDC15 protein kinase [Kwoniella heveanensis BCC8398]|uniref:STE/STE11/CDC15 protein kinase n=1 Tax=Kwoniella heveanensis BCC8398 TaxID=1296120 RepID=A0A1B9GQD8_9TREE|nr:STE/STE11/CDC15 protein kinase [Kwoniella heveanensis BCC8398]